MMTEVLNWGGVNVWLFHAINGVHNLWWDRLMIIGAQLTENEHVAILVGFALIIGTIVKRRSDSESNWFRTSLVLGVSYVLTSATVFGVKHMVASARPAELLPREMVRILAVPGDPYSFPSGHAALVAMLVTALWPRLSIPARVAALFFVVWVGLARVAVGAHFPADVIAGALIGALLTWLIRLLVDRILRPVTTSTSPLDVKL